MHFMFASPSLRKTPAADDSIAAAAAGSNCPSLETRIPRDGRATRVGSSLLQTMAETRGNAHVRGRQCKSRAKRKSQITQSSCDGDVLLPIWERIAGRFAEAV